MTSPLLRILLVAASLSAASCRTEPGAGASHHRPDASTVPHRPAVPPDAEVAPEPRSSASGAAQILLSRDGRLMATVEPAFPAQWLRTRNPATLAVQGTFPLCLVSRRGAWERRRCTLAEYPVVHAAALAPDGRAVALVCEGCAQGRGSTIHALDLTSGALRFAASAPEVTFTLAWTGDELVLGHLHGFQRRDARTGAVRVDRRLREAITAVGPDGAILVTGATRSVLDANGEVLRKLRFSGQTPVIALEGGAVVAFQDGAKAVDARGRETGAPFYYTAGSLGPVGVSRDGAWGAATMHGRSGANPIRRFHLRTGAMLERDLPAVPKAVAVGPDGVVWVAYPGAGPERLAWPPIALSAALSRDGRRLAAVEQVADLPGATRLRIRDLPDGALRVDAAAPAATRLAWSRDGRILALAAAPGTDASSVLLVDAASGKATRRVTLASAARDLVFGPFHLFVTDGRSVEQLDPVTGAVGRRLVAAEGAWLGPFAPDGTAVLERVPGRRWERMPRPGARQWGAEPDRVAMIDLPSGQRRVVDPASRGEVLLLGGGAWLRATGPGSGPPSVAVRLVRPAAPEIALTLQGSLVAVSADGRCAATSDGSYAIRVYRLPGGELAATGEPHARTTAVAIGRGCSLWFGTPHRALARGSTPHMTGARRGVLPR